MLAACADRYGPPDVVVVRDVPLPTPGPGQVLVRVAATPVTVADARIRGARFPKGFGHLPRLALGVRRPRATVLGGSYAGEVAAVGAGVVVHSAGDRVCGLTDGLGGAHAEYVLAAENGAVARIPDDVTDVDAAAMLFGGVTALWFLRDRGRVAPGMHVVVNGASGAVGTNAVQIAKYFGATVTAVCSGGNAALVRSLGADHVIDYARQPLAGSGGRYDVVLDAVGNLSIAEGTALLAPAGLLLLAVPTLAQLVVPRSRVVRGGAPERLADVQWLLQRAARGELRAVVDRTLPLADAVAAHRIVDGGHKRGNVVLTLPAGDGPGR